MVWNCQNIASFTVFHKIISFYWKKQSTFFFQNRKGFIVYDHVHLVVNHPEGECQRGMKHCERIVLEVWFLIPKWVCLNTFPKCVSLWISKFDRFLGRHLPLPLDNVMHLVRLIGDGNTALVYETMCKYEFSSSYSVCLNLCSLFLIILSYYVGYLTRYYRNL